MSSSVPGRLVLVGTPIGNLGDISPRAVEALTQAAAVACEDTRRTGRLLSHLGIPSPTYIVVNEHTEGDAAERVIGHVQRGEIVALVSDAGTPAISDPGFLLVRECIKENLKVETLPGATAFVPALVNSGLPCDRFCFEGFLPVKKGRQTKFKELATLNCTFIIYESPHRLMKTLADFKTYFGEDRIISVSRELTKIYEETTRGTVLEVIEYYTTHIAKGEFVICIAGK